MLACQRLDWLNRSRCRIDRCSIVSCPIGLDVAWGAFIQILEAVAVKRGIQIVKVSPYGTSQNCSDCGTKVPKTLSIRTHECPKCGLTIDRDENAAINVLNRAIEQLKAVGLIVSAHHLGVDSSQPKKQ